MAFSSGRMLGQSLGKLFRNVSNPRWIAAEGTKAGTAIVIYNSAGQQVNAFLHGHFHHDDGKLGDHYKDKAGNEYIVVNNRKYRFEPDDDAFYEAD